MGIAISGMVPLNSETTFGTRAVMSSATMTAQWSYFHCELAVGAAAPSPALTEHCKTLKFTSFGFESS